MKQLMWAFLSLLSMVSLAYAAPQVNDNATNPAATTAAPATVAPGAANPASTTPAQTATEAATPNTPAASTPAATPTTSAAAPEAAAPLLPADAQRGLAKSETCAACHGVDGNSPIPDYPKLAGQSESYLVQSLQDYKKGAEGGRNNPIMYGMVANLSEQDMLDLAAYYAGQKITLGEADPSLVGLGERIYRGGNVDANVPACIACHGPRGEGNALAKFPALSGQNAAYVAAQLHAFRSGTRGGGVNDMMAHVVQRMSEEEINAVASYISGLH